MCGWARRFLARGEVVVPANAGTHNHRPSFGEGCPPLCVIDHAVWVPAFAGTTLSVTDAYANSADVFARASALRAYPMTIFVCGLIRRNKRSIEDFVIETQPAVGEKLFRARCRNTALPRPAMRGVRLWSISTMKS
jgi:hypothetical protein